MNDPRTGLSLWLDRLSLRSALGVAEREAVLALPGKIECIRANRDFVRLGEQVDRSCLILAGMAGRFGQARSGERLTTAIHIAGDMADLHSAVLPKAASALQSLGETIIYRVPHEDVMDAAERFPALAQAFWRDCTVDAAVLSQWSLTNARQPAIERLAHLLAELSVRFGIGGERDDANFEFPLTQTQLGDATNLTAVHVNRMLRNLRVNNVVEIRDRRVRVLDWKRLCAIADFDPTYLHLRRAD
ncbi:MAG: Crp/Fnr family transcriptional regulator [Sphingomonas sp.]